MSIPEGRESDEGSASLDVKWKTPLHSDGIKQSTAVDEIPC
jgi:hypothetical protein